MKRLFLYLFLYVCAGAGVFGQTNGDLRHVSIDEGLTGDCVYCILKDSRGLTWVGTNNGISLYDGQHAETVECDVRRSLNLVHDLVELADGSIVAAMRGGLFHVNRQTLTVRQVCPQLQDVRTLLVLGDSLLVGSGSGLTIVEPRPAWRVTPVTLGNSRMARDNRIADVCSDGQGGAWVMSASALYHLDGRLHITRTKADFSAVRDGLRCVCAVGNRVYIGTSWQGLLCYDRLTHRLQAVEEVADGVVADLHSDGNRLFVALDGGGAVVLAE